jgi:hypothetical protein
MSRANSSKAGIGRTFLRLGVTALGAALVSCAHAATSPGDAGPATPNSKIGYVRMEALVKVHPLYSQLARLDDDMAALALKSVGANIAHSGEDIAKDERDLQAQLDAAAARTTAALKGKEQEYAQKEQAAINAALGAGAGATGPGSAQIAGAMNVQAQAQAQAVEQAANHNLDAYRGELVKQDQAAEHSLQVSLAERAQRTYRAEADRLQKNESDFALQQAGDDAADRLSLRTKLSNLALDDASRADVKAQLDAIDRKEADALGAMRNRDQLKLVALQRQLHDQIVAELGSQVAEIRKRTNGKINERVSDTRKELVGQIGRLGAGGGPGGAVVPGGVTPDMKAKLVALHQKFQHDFNDDAAKTVAEFKKTRSDLVHRFQALSGVDSQAQAGAGQEMNTLQKQRGDLYNEMVAQIGREVKVVAERRGINVVVSDVVAPAGGVDLTDDAEKDIESLHE